MGTGICTARIHRASWPSTSYNARYSTNELLSAIDTEIATLKQVRALLAGTGRPMGSRAGRPQKRHYTLSAAARAKIAAAQKKRWAKQKAAAK